MNRNKPLPTWDFSLSMVVSPCTSRAGSDALGALEFDPPAQLLATGGIAKKIRIYRTQTLESEDNHSGFPSTLTHNDACEFFVCTPAKLGCLKWRPDFIGRVIGSGDSDGSITEYDIETRMSVFERDEHGGRRIRAMDYASWNPVLGASGSDDGTLQLWDPRCDRTVETVRPAGSNPVCCVEFDPFGRPLLLIGSSNRKAYGYDIRMMATPIFELEAHSKPVTYVRFLDTNTVVTSATDGCLKQWDINTSSVIRTHRGHINARNFIGLSVWRAGGLLGCGSESDEVFVYDRSWEEPIWVSGFGSRSGNRFVSGVCWREVETGGCWVVGGGSDGSLQVFKGKVRE